MPENNKKEKTDRYIEYTIATLVAILVVLIFFLALNYRDLRRSAVVGARQSWLSALIAHHGPATVNDLSFVRPWMTFDYLNKFFNVPPQYLQNQLTITDPHYPRLTISAYARNNNLNIATLMSELDAALRAHLIANPPPDKTATSSRL